MITFYSFIVEINHIYVTKTHKHEEQLPNTSGSIEWKWWNLGSDEIRSPDVSHWMETQPSPLPSFNPYCWLAKESTVELQGRQKHGPDWGIKFATEGIYYLPNHWPTTLQPFYNHANACASFEQPTSSEMFMQLFRTKELQQLWNSWQYLDILLTTFEWLMQPCGILAASNSNRDTFMVAQRRLKEGVKGV